jgi:hypothetical protein
MHLRRSTTGFVCIFNRSPSQVKRGLGPVRVWYTPRMKAKPISLYPLKFKEVIRDVLQVKPESKAKPKRKARKPKTSN